MRHLHRYLGSLLVGAVLIAPVGAMATPFEEHHNCPNNGYYDRDHRDCHEWNDHENRAYQEWQKAHHKTDREFAKLKSKEQSEYWKWRHEHPDHDEDRH